MQSAEFVTTYNNAASIVERRCQGLAGVSTLLDDIRRRIFTDEHDPLKNRQLIFEPLHEAQRLDVPQQSAQTIAEELHRLAIFHLWVRAICPAVDEGDPDTVIETDNSARLQEALRSPCPQCGQYHENLSLENVRTFYAVNFTSGPDTFDFRRLFQGRPKPLAKSGNRGTNPRTGWFNWRLFRIRQEPPATAVTRQIVAALAVNQDVPKIPDSLAVCLGVWKAAATYILLAVLLFVGAHQIFGAYVGAVVAAFLILAFGVASFVTLRLVMATPLIQRMLVFGGFTSSALLIAHSQFDLDASVSQDEHWHFAFKTHDTDWPSIIGAVVLLFVSICGACAHQWMTGWFNRPHA